MAKAEMEYYKEVLPSDKKNTAKIAQAFVEYFRGSKNKTQCLLEALIGFRKFTNKFAEDAIKAANSGDVEKAAKLIMLFEYIDFLEKKIDEMPMTETVTLLTEIEKILSEKDYSKDLMIDFLDNAFKEYSAKSIAKEGNA